MCLPLSFFRARFRVIKLTETRANLAHRGLVTPASFPAQMFVIPLLLLFSFSPPSSILISFFFLHSFDFFLSPFSLCRFGGADDDEMGGITYWTVVPGKMRILFG